MSETEPGTMPEGGSGARRSRRKRKSKTGFWANPALGRRIAIGVSLLGLLLLVLLTYQMRHASLLVGPLQIGASDAEVAYAMGPADRVDADGQRWSYSLGISTLLMVEFDADRQVDAIRCVTFGPGATGCPQLMGIGLGTSEELLVNRLGPPSSFSYIPNGKTVTYDDMGISFTMHQFRVTGYSKTARTSRIGFIPRVFWSFMP